MTIAESFYLLFKGDATDALSATAKVEKATNDLADATAALDKAQEASGKNAVKQLTEEEKKLQQLKKEKAEAAKQLKQAQAELAKSQKDEEKRAKDIGKAYTDIVGTLGGMVTAFLSLDAIKGGLASAQKTTADLQMQSKWLGQNADDIAAYGNAVTSVGGTVEGFQGTLKKLHDQYAMAGINASVPMIMQNLVNTAREWDKLGYSQQQKETMGLRMGLDEGTILLMSQGADAMQRQIDEYKKLLDLTPADTEAARGISTEWNKTKTAFESLYNKINTDLYPILKGLFGLIRDFVEWLAAHPKFAEGMIAGITAIGIVLGGGLIAKIIKLGAALGGVGEAAAGVGGAIEGGGIIAGIAALAGAAAEAALPFLALAAAITGVWKVMDWVDIPGRSYDAMNWVGRKINKLLGRGDADGYLPGKRPKSVSEAANASLAEAASTLTPGPADGSTLGLRNNNPGNLRPGGREAYYPTPEAGIAAMANNLRRYGRRGWDSVSSIISHWAPPNENNTAAYIAAVSKATGFDANQKLDLSDPQVLQKLTNAIIQHENGSNPYNQAQIQQSIARGQQTLQAASASPFNASPGPWGTTSSSTSSIKIDTINVQTQATDAAGIASAIGSSLKASLRNATSNLDDGVLA